MAGITITILFGDNGIISQAQKAKTATEQDEKNTQEGLANLADQMASQLGEDVSDLAKFIKSDESKEVLSKEQGNKILKDKSGKQIIIPVGFKIASDSATEIDKGVVIEDKTGNQFVWVPVPEDKLNTMFDTKDGENVGKLYDIKNSASLDNLSPIDSNRREPDIVTNCDGNDSANPDSFKTFIGDITGAQFKAELQEEFDNMKNSVKEYKGFYIGRFETSNIKSSTSSYLLPRVKRGVIPSAKVNWYYMYAELKNIEKQNKENGYVNNDVVTSMIWGCQWDRTLIWLVESGNKKFEELKNSNSWGNYRSSEFKYKDIDGTEKLKEKGDAYGSGKLIPTGSTEYTNSNNIYDLAGNLWEWTLEAHSATQRVDYRRLLF